MMGNDATDREIEAFAGVSLVEFFARRGGVDVFSMIK